MAKILGIDLGTTNSAVAVMEGRSEDIGEQRRSAHHSSIVAVNKSGERLTGLLGS